MKEDVRLTYSRVKGFELKVGGKIIPKNKILVPVQVFIDGETLPEVRVELIPDAIDIKDAKLVQPNKSNVAKKEEKS